MAHQSEQGEVSDIVTWVDDVALAVMGEADDISKKAMHLLAIVQGTMLEHGFGLS